MKCCDAFQLPIKTSFRRYLNFLSGLPNMETNNSQQRNIFALIGWAKFSPVVTSRINHMNSVFYKYSLLSQFTLLDWLPGRPCCILVMHTNEKMIYSFPLYVNKSSFIVSLKLFINLTQLPLNDLIL